MLFCSKLRNSLAQFRLFLVFFQSVWGGKLYTLRFHCFERTVVFSIPPVLSPLLTLALRFNLQVRRSKALLYFNLRYLTVDFTFDSCHKKAPPLEFLVQDRSAFLSAEKSATKLRWYYFHLDFVALPIATAKLPINFILRTHAISE